jgi:hypothetical protein
MLKLSILGATAVVVVATSALVAGASAPPVGPLPPGPVTTINVKHGQLFAVALPGPLAGLAWRIARPYDTKVVRGVDEANVGKNIVIVYRAVNPGKTTVIYALTVDETPKAKLSRRFAIIVS